ncbi:hypothetical protein PVK06_024948 [Gossypium arboreum]|uniref:Uncharacterized protein n=1 Tax=Gossypium arboreum TaxID=29729 RepID=A0ABR0PFQ6_GOSAR|nr:hypothetical protein PVK06_024948 [Gossypium arboreum]
MMGRGAGQAGTVLGFGGVGLVLVCELLWARRGARMVVLGTGGGWVGGVVCRGVTVVVMVRLELGDGVSLRGWEA